jgi:adenylosuccinate lyase
VVRPERMAANIEATGGLVFSQRVLLKLVEAGMTREAAYQLVQRHAMAAAAEPAKSFRQRLTEDPEVSRWLSKAEVEGLFSVEPYLKEVDYIFNRIGIERSTYPAKEGSERQ